MKTQKPTMAELMVGNPSSPSRPGSIEKAAAQAQVGEVFDGLTKEAKEELIGTMGWAGRAFGEQCGSALQPVVEKLASLVTELKELSKAAKTNLKNMEQPELYRDGNSSGANPGGLPAKLKDPHTEGNEANVEATATPTSNKKHPGETGWSKIQGDKQRKLQATVVDEQGKTASEQGSSVLAALRGAQPTQEKSASLADLGAQFKAQLKNDLAQS